MFRRLGDVRDRCSNFRLITATHHDVSALVREKRFRSDLYFRINTVVLRVPSLRERREDIPVIAEELLSDLSVSVGRPRLRISERGMDALLRHSWPGNIRELRNALESAVLLSESDVLDTFFFDSDVIPFSTSQSADSSASENAEFLTLEEVEIKHILSVLSSVNGNVVLAATRLNIGKTTLYRRLKQLHISAANIA
jgi:DNA-binding NtrC family response regulator